MNMSAARTVEHHTTVDVEKSLIDHRTYRYFQLENGIKVVIVSSLKPGEEPEGATLCLETSSCDGTDSGGDGNSSTDDNDSDDNGAATTDPNKQESYVANENKAAAALCISVGSLSDPPEAQGLSHFLEHMVFMGSAKYPTENDFDAYLSQRGGSTNAYTDGEHTMFYFDVKCHHFAACLDRFAQFFIHPLLHVESVDREIEAVHSEYELAKVKDDTHVGHFLSTLVSADSPLRLFGYGNKRSLKEIPEANGTDIYTLLRRHREDHYSATRMTLSIQSKETLDHMEDLVREMFSSVPNSGVPTPDYSKFSSSYDVSALNRIHRICPIGVKEKISLVWPLPPHRSLYDSHPLGVISSLLGHEGPGSVLALLKEKNWAVALATGSPVTSDSDNGSFFSLFTVSITLTEAAIDHVYEVAGIVFDYLKMLLAAAETAFRQASQCTSDGDTVPDACSNDGSATTAAKRVAHATLASYLPEFVALRHTHFFYSEPTEATDTVSCIATMLRLVPPDRVLSAYSVFKKPDLKLCVDWLRQLTPERVAVIHLSSRFASSLSEGSPAMTVQVEPWFQTRYLSEDIPESVMQTWLTSKPCSDLHLPYRNIYLTTEFDLLPAVNDMKQPYDLSQTPLGSRNAQYGHLWFQQTTKFKAPKATVIFHLWSPIVEQDVENFVLHSLLIYMLKQSMDTIAYEAVEANYEYSLSSIHSSLSLNLHGFNQKLFNFFVTILDHLLDESVPLTQEQFKSYRETFRRYLFNQSIKASALNDSLQQHLLMRNQPSYEDMLTSLRQLSLADLIAYRQRFFARLRITAYVHGNLRPEEAVRFFEYAVDKLKCSPYFERKFNDCSVLQPGVYHLRVRNCNPKDVNMCLALVNLLGKTDIKRDTMNWLLAHILSEPTFDYLRTKETLGYRVYLRSSRSIRAGNLHSSISLVACSQANKHSVGHVAGRLLAFWYRIAPRILVSMSLNSFKVAVDSLISLNQMEDPNMSTEVDRNWIEVLFGEAMFNRREARVKVLRSVSRDDLLDFFLTDYLDPASRQSLLVEVDALPEAGDCSLSLSPKSLPIAREIKMTEELWQSVDASLKSVDVYTGVATCLGANQTVKQADDIDEMLRRRVKRLRLEGGHTSVGRLMETGDELLQPLHCIDSVRAFCSRLTYEPGRCV